jgi:demethylmenaquinone methyltransferase/2-methoxy-6-polyprenyl-1,4-benzoquinol methylase
MQTDPAFSFESREEKKNYVKRMFAEIAGRYDFFNHVLSLGFDYRWRRRAIALLKKRMGDVVMPNLLDVACGTGDLAFEALRQIPRAEITGLDLTRPMLDLFEKKIAKRHATITVMEGDVEALAFDDNEFHGVTIGFGTRNFTNLSIAFQEIYRVLKPGGVFVNLELAKPRAFPMKQLYALYFNGLLPMTATLLSRHDSAYKYLPDSLRRFPDLEALQALMTDCGFKDARFETHTGGIVAIHSAVK